LVNLEYCARSILLLKLTTDIHEGSRGLSATAELHVRRVKKENGVLHIIAFCIFIFILFFLPCWWWIKKMFIISNAFHICQK